MRRPWKNTCEQAGCSLFGPSPEGTTHLSEEQEEQDRDEGGCKVVVVERGHPGRPEASGQGGQEGVAPRFQGPGRLEGHQLAREREAAVGGGGGREGEEPEGAGDEAASEAGRQHGAEARLGRHP